MLRNGRIKVELLNDLYSNQATDVLSKELADQLYLAEKAYAEMLATASKNAAGQRIINKTKLEEAFAGFIKVAEAKNKYAIARMNEIALEFPGGSLAILANRYLKMLAADPINDPVATFNLASRLVVTEPVNARKYLQSLDKNAKKNGNMVLVNLSDLTRLLDNEYTRKNKDYFPNFGNAAATALLLTPILMLSSFLSSVAEVTGYSVVRGRFPRSLLSLITVPIGFVAGVVWGAITAAISAVKGPTYDAFSGGWRKYAHLVGLDWMKAIASWQHPEGYSLSGCSLVHPGVNARKQKAAEILNSRPVAVHNPSLLALQNTNQSQVTHSPAPTPTQDALISASGPLFGVPSERSSTPPAAGSVTPLAQHVGDELKAPAP